MNFAALTDTPKPVHASPYVVPVVASTDPSAVRRVESADLVELQGWLIPRLQEKYPDATAPQIIGFLRSAIASNEWWFCRTQLACGLVQLLRMPLEAQPVVQEFFVLAQEDGGEDAAQMYIAIASWAAIQNASRLIVGRHSDVTLATIAYRLGVTLRATGGRYALLGRLY